MCECIVYLYVGTIAQANYFNIVASGIILYLRKKCLRLYFKIQKILSVSFFVIYCPKPT
jgi:hypothetical protein